MARSIDSIAKPHRQWDPDYAIRIFIGFLIIRSLNVLGTNTFFQPDEFYQSLEPAWQLAFGADSGAWLTWEWREGLRSALHPLIFAAVYKAVSTITTLFTLSAKLRADILVLTPKCFSVLIAASIDMSTWELARICYGGSWSPETFATLMLTVISPWQWFCSLRTFSNTLETALTIYALSKWPWQWTIQQMRGSTAPDQAKQAVKDSIDLRKILEDGGKSKDYTKTAEKSPKAAKTAPKVSTKETPDVEDSDIRMGNLMLALTAAAIACILRPTNIVIWIALLLASLYRYGSSEKAVKLAKSSILVGVAVLSVSLTIDRLYYGRFVFPQAKFLQVNLVQSLSIFYGRNRIDYYVTEGLPLLLTTALPFGVVGLWQSLRPGLDKQELAGYYERQTRFLLAFVVIATIAAFTAIAHKEVRFIYPLLPILHILAAKPFASFFSPLPLPEDYIKLGLLILMINVNVYIQTYVGLVHQRGVMDVIDFLRHQAETFDGVKQISVGFLMPCHSTAWRSRLVHSSIEAWALTCEPPINMSAEQRADYMDEADVFYAHPGGWLAANMQDRKSILRTSTPDMITNDTSLLTWPDYLVFFEQLEPVMNAALDRTRYEECWRGFNSHWHDDWRRRGDVIVQCLDTPKLAQ